MRPQHLQRHVWRAISFHMGVVVKRRWCDIRNWSRARIAPRTHREISLSLVEPRSIHKKQSRLAIFHRSESKERSKRYYRWKWDRLQVTFIDCRQCDGSLWAISLQVRYLWTFEESWNDHTYLGHRPSGSQDPAIWNSERWHPYNIESHAFRSVRVISTTDSEFWLCVPDILATTSIACVVRSSTKNHQMSEKATLQRQSVPISSSSSSSS